MKNIKSSFCQVVLLMLLLFFGGEILALSQNRSVRLAMVNVPDELVRPLLPDFQKQTGLNAEIVYTGNDPFAVAREGKADLVISHYGHEGVQAFITGGYGEWPRPVFANQMALLGPKSDPAHIRNLTDAVEAFRRIATSQSPFVTNNGAGAKYLEDVLWLSAKIEKKGSWYLDLKSHGPQAAQDAASKNAYVLWGLAPYLRLNRKAPMAIEPLVVQDPIFQRMMVSIVVNPQKIAGANSQSALAFQTFLLSPATQARIREFRYPDFKSQAWWSAGRHNAAQE
jgi:tungstate transport system substrate-binding protein